METFLGKLADKLVEEFGDDFRGITVVFPTRRAGIFFRSELSKRMKQPVWAPQVTAIQDLMMQWSGHSLPDNITLLFELFDVYKEFFPEETFDSYYPWGEVLLKDFEELDKALGDHRRIFSLISDLKEIDESFGLGEEETERLRVFWANFFQRDLSVLKAEFIQTWKFLPEIYSRFHDRLKEKGWSTEGRAFRTVAESVGKSDDWEEKAGRHIFFAGLYALSRSEERLIEFLIENDKASVYWDADDYYVNDQRQEAGLFLRRSDLFRKWNNWRGNKLTGSPKSIDVIGIPMEIGQAKMAGHLVQELLKTEGFQPEKTAVVLPDEHLLFPVLYALPSELDKINVTMGYPLHQTPIYHLFESLISLQTNSRRSKSSGNVSFYHKDVLAILDHPYIWLVDQGSIRRWQEEFKKNFAIRIDQSAISADALGVVFKMVFKRVEDSKELFSWCKSVLALILQAMDEREFAGHRLESEFIARFHQQLSRLEEIYVSVEAESTVETWWSLFRELIRSTKIPFTGEPLEGLQVMGFLESRVLDFENLIVLSVNEDILPSKGMHPSFIPFGLRKAFGLPTHEDQHAVTAYHFYRLLQRASRISLLYNTESHSMTSGEPSRFIRQLEYELVPNNTEHVSWRRRYVSTPVLEPEIAPVVVEKSRSVMEALERYLWKDDGPLEYHPKLSPSAINAYINCPLQFYFKFIAGLEEPREVEEEIEASTFGSALHKAMEILYKGVKLLEKKDFAAIHKKVEAAVDQAMEETFVHPDQLEGKNLLKKQVIVELVRRILELDESDAPIQIQDLELIEVRPFALDDHRTILLKGIIDRVDAVGDQLRVLDYKTGKVNFRKLKDIRLLFSDSANKEQFQATLYAWLMSKKINGKPIRVGLITLKEMKEGVKFLNNGNPVSAEQLTDFEAGLRGLLNSMFDPSVPFVQTKDETRCVYCAYKDICSR